MDKSARGGVVYRIDHFLLSSAKRRNRIEFVKRGDSKLDPIAFTLFAGAIILLLLALQ